MRIELINKQLTLQQGQPIYGSHYIGISNAIFWREEKLKTQKIPKKSLIDNIRYLKRKLDLIVAFNIN